MSLAMMAYTLPAAGSMWINPNVIAVIWLGPEVAGRETMLAALAYTLASSPFVFALFLSWLNPLMIDGTQIVPMTAAHVIPSSASCSAPSTYL